MNPNANSGRQVTFKRGYRVTIFGPHGASGACDYNMLHAEIERSALYSKLTYGRI
jgi:hypothetical protein